MTTIETLRSSYIIGQANFDSWSQGFDPEGYLKVLPHPDETIPYEDPFQQWKIDHANYKNGVFVSEGADGGYYSSWGPDEVLEVTLNVDELEQLVIDGFGILEQGDHFIDWLGKATPYDILRAYNGKIPGPMLITEPGDTLKITLNNNLDEITNLHTHGLHVSAVGNGDNVLITIPPGGSWVTEIKIPEDHFIGPQWYHPHFHGETNEQVASGLGAYLLINPRHDLPDLDKFDPVENPAFFMAIQSFGIQQEYRFPSPDDPLNQSPTGAFVPAGTPLLQSTTVEIDAEYALQNSFQLIDGTNVFRVAISGSDPDALLPTIEGLIYGTIDQNGIGTFNSDPMVFGLEGLTSGFVGFKDAQGNRIFGTDEANSRINFLIPPPDGPQVNATGLITVKDGEGIFDNAQGILNLSELGIFNPNAEFYTPDLKVKGNFTVPRPIEGLQGGEVKYTLAEAPFVGYNGKPLTYNPQAPQGNPPGPNFSSAYGEGALAETTENVIHTVNGQYNPTIETTTGGWNLFSFANMTVNSFHVVQLLKEEADGTLTPQEMLLTAIDGDAAGVVEGIRREVSESPVLNPGSRVSLQNWFEEPGKYYFLSNATDEVLGDNAPLLTQDNGFQDGHLNWGSQVLATIEVTGNDIPTGAFPEPYDILIEQSNEINALVDNALANGVTQERTFVWSANVGGALAQGNQPDDTEVKTFEGTYTINGEFFATEGGGMPPLTMPMLGSTEIWNLQNTSGIDDERLKELGINIPLLEWHPFHIHQNDFVVLEINGIPVEDIEDNYLARVLSDTIALSPAYTPGSVTPQNPYGTPQLNGLPSEVKILMEFADYPGAYVNHCHILFHEDAGMMAVVKVILNTDNTWLGLGTDRGSTVSLFKASNTEQNIRLNAFNSANGVNVAIADVNYKNNLGAGNTNVTDNVTDVVTIQKQLTSTDQRFTVKVFDGQRLFDAVEGRVNFNAVYQVNGGGEIFAPDFSRADIFGTDNQASYGFNTLEGSTYILRNGDTGEFTANTNPSILGQPSFPQTRFTIVGNDEDKLFAQENAEGIVNPDGTINNQGTFTITGGQGKFQNSTGEINFVEVGYSDPVNGVSSTLSTEGTVQITPQNNINGNDTDLLLVEFTPFQDIQPTLEQKASVASGDIDGDGFADIVAAIGGGVTPLIEVYSGKNYELMASLAPFHHEDFTGNINIAVGDVNGDNFYDILVSQGSGGRGLVEAYDGKLLEGLIQSGIRSLSPIGVAHDTAFLHSDFQPYGDFNGEVKITSGYVLQTPDVPNGLPVQTSAGNITTLAVGDLPEGQERIKIHTLIGGHGSHGSDAEADTSINTDSEHDHGDDSSHNSVLPDTVNLSYEFTPNSDIQDFNGTFADVNGSRGEGVLFSLDNQGNRQLIHLKEGNIPEYVSISSNNLLDTPFYRFHNSDVAGAYLYVGEEEAQSVLENYPNFKEEGFAFNVSTTANDELISLYRFQNSNLPGAYLYVGEQERQSIKQNNTNFVEDGLAFYAYGADANKGEDIYRFQNIQNPGSYIYVGESERQSIEANFASQFTFEGVAFEALT